MAVFDYLMLKLERGVSARVEFAERVAASGLSGGGRKAAGLFTPQIGWEAAHVAILVERGADAARLPVALEALVLDPAVVSCRFHKLTPTLRPGPGDTMKPGGIYVHRWFEVTPAAVDEFIALSGQAWPDFESRFDANIFGLFALTPDSSEDAQANRHLLLVTRYASHQIWEDSRDPASNAMQIFARRAMITQSTRAASTLLVPL